MNNIKLTFYPRISSENWNSNKQTENIHILTFAYFLELDEYS